MQEKKKRDENEVIKRNGKENKTNWKNKSRKKIISR